MNYPHKKNKYGGFRLLSDWQIDIWFIEETLAFRTNTIKYSTPSDILKTTMFNWDAILYSYNEKKLYCSDTFFDEIKSNQLELNNENIPNKAGFVKKLLRYTTNNNVHIGYKLRSYLLKNKDSLLKNSEITSIEFKEITFLFEILEKNEAGALQTQKSRPL